MLKFGTGGWRALIGSEFTEENVKLVTTGIAELAKIQQKSDKPIVIGYDNRFLSEIAAQWIANTLANNNIHSILLTQAVPTPLVMHMVQSKHLHYGICVTASHNPYQYNGIKFFTEEGRDADVDTTWLLEKLIQNAKVVNDTVNEISKKYISYLNFPFSDYIDNIINQIDCNVLKQSKLKVLVDPMHGSGLYPLSSILSSVNVEYEIINGNRDAFFGWKDPAPTQNTLQELQCKVVEGNYDLGIALDGDGDRLGIIDSNGRYISANEILSMLYWYLHTYKQWHGPVVKNLATTYMLDAIASSFNEQCYEVPIGFKHISSAIDKYDAVLGGESSGGLTVRGHIHGKDSIYAAMLFIEMLSTIGKSASEILNDLTVKYGRFEMVECNVHLSNEHMSEIKLKLSNHDLNIDFKSNIVGWNYNDGVKFYFEDNSWVICRPSGTEPLLRIFAEASNVETANRYIEAIKREFSIQ